jgi:serine/threonine-protein kinase RIM15
MAPEVIKGLDHNFTVDFWALGVIAYEFITGALPFNDDSPDLVFKKILKKEMTWPPIGTEENEMSPEAFDFINRLLELDPQKRLGKNGINELKDHPFFSDIKWDEIMDEPVPMVPQGRDFDPSNFPKANDNDEELDIITKDKKHNMIS